MKIVGYGICGAGEADRFMRRTISQMKELCDDVIILLNNATQKEKQLASSLGCRTIFDNREWGKFQNHIKESLLRDHVTPQNPDACLTLDMDEVLSEKVDRQVLEELTKWHSTAFYFVQHWNDEQTYNDEFGFWSVRFFKWNGDTRFLNRPLQCGLVPKWALDHCSYAPHYIKHYGLMSKEDRQRKVERYEKYDPDNKYLPTYYKKLKTKSEGLLFSHDSFQETLEREVAKYGDQIKIMINEEKEKFWYVKNPHGQIIDIPDRHLQEVLRKPGFTLLSKEPIVLLGNDVKTTSIAKAVSKSEEQTIEADANNPQSLICETCKFEAKSVFGLRVHSRKHA
jgi:hypothetical protein